MIIEGSSRDCEGRGGGGGGGAAVRGFAVIASGRSGSGAGSIGT